MNQLDNQYVQQSDVKEDASVAINAPRKAMRILLITTHLNVGGIPVYVISLARGLSDQGHEVHVASSGGVLVKRLDSWGIPHHVIALRTKSELSPQLWLAQQHVTALVRSLDIQLVHGQTRVSQVLAALVARRCGIAKVATCHGFYRRRLGRRLWPCWGDHTVAISGSVHQHLLQQWGVDQSRAHRVHNGIDLRLFEDMPSAEAQSRFRSDIGLTGGPVVVTVARLVPVKGQKYVLEAVAKLRADMPRIRLLLVGQGPERLSLERRAQALGFQDHVSFLTDLTEPRLPLSVADVLVLPTLDEGFGLVLLEAMACHLPVVASRVGGIDEIVKDGVSGSLVPPEDSDALRTALHVMLSDPERARQLGRAGRQVVEERFTLEQMVAETTAVYERALGEHT